MRAFIDESYTDTRYFIAAALGTEAERECVSSALTAIRERAHAEHGTSAKLMMRTVNVYTTVGIWTKANREKTMTVKR